MVGSENSELFLAARALLPPCHTLCTHLPLQQSLSLYGCGTGGTHDILHACLYEGTHALPLDNHYTIRKLFYNLPQTKQNKTKKITAHAVLTIVLTADSTGRLRALFHTRGLVTHPRQIGAMLDATCCPWPM